jgi:saccharopine dehydrogenase (NADP+, L-glutamate forming)
MILTGQLQNRGVVMPIIPEIYNPVLDELEEFGIHFVEKEIHPPRLYENDLQPWN